MRIRRFCGAALMIAGAAGVTAMATLAVVVTANYVEWDNAADALGTVALVTVPPGVIGGLLILVGRKVYGSWRHRAPMRKATAWVVRSAGFIVTAVLGGLFLLLMAAGAGPDDRSAAISLGLGTILGLAISFVGFWMNPRKRPPV